MSVPAPEATLASRIGQIAAVLGSDNFPPGERAALRRMGPSQLPPLAFYRFAGRYLPANWDRDADTRDDWTVLVAGMALMSPHAHRPDRGLGSALAAAGYADARLERLLAAAGDTRRTLLLRTARFLAAKSEVCNWVDAAQLLLTRDPERREALHRRIAKDFYGVLEAAKTRTER
jgi:CRISPR system Cascade subunit CasB